MSVQEQIGPSNHQRGREAIRFIFEYDADEVPLVSRQRVDMLVPPSDALPPYDEMLGFWIEMRTADDATLYRRILHDPLRGDAELFSDDPAQSLRRTPVQRPAGVFSVLVPDLDGAEQLVVMGTPPGPEVAEAAAEIFRLSLGCDEQGGAS